MPTTLHVPKINKMKSKLRAAAAADGAKCRKYKLLSPYQTSISFSLSSQQEDLLVRCNKTVKLFKEDQNTPFVKNQSTDFIRRLQHRE